nr:MAG TPA: hypothetical protein [Caudoviricetes sp.]
MVKILLIAREEERWRVSQNVRYVKLEGKTRR